MTTAPGIQRGYWHPMTQQEWAAFYGISRGQTGRGSGMTYFHGTQNQRGSGFGSLFSGLLRAVMPVAKTALKAVGREALRTGVSVASDALAGQNVAQSLEHHGRQAAGKLVRKAGRHLTTTRRQKMMTTRKRGRRRPVMQAGGGMGTRLRLPAGGGRAKPINRPAAAAKRRRRKTIAAANDYLNF